MCFFAYIWDHNNKIISKLYDVQNWNVREVIFGVINKSLYFRDLVLCALLYWNQTCRSLNEKVFES